MKNIILMTDSYKSSHFRQYPPNMDGMFSYVESRGGRWDEVVFFGLQYLLKEYLVREITKADVLEAATFFAAHGEPFPIEGWLKVVNTYGGKLPIKIRAVPEGTVVPTHNVLLTVECNDPDLFWLVSWVETMLMRVWYPITVATLSFHAKKGIYEMLQKTADDPDTEISFKLHDFGARGVSSSESAAIGGAAHLVNFMGSDTVEGVVMANQYYGTKAGMAAFSIPAAEHSTITSWGRENEVDAFANMLKQFAKPGSLVAVVSDSYNIWNAVENLWGGKLKEEVIKSGATVVIRPDSGDPREVVLKILQILDSKFGSTVNSKGYKVLNNVRVIQGDGITVDTIVEILAHSARGGYSSSNIAFGMGGGLLQQVNRDTQRFAYKCSAAHFKGEGWKDVFKDPVTDPGKASKGGRLSLYLENGKFKTSADTSWGDKKLEVLNPVFENGVILEETNFDDVRSRATEGLKKILSLV